MRIGDVLADAKHQLIECLDESDYGEARPLIERLSMHIALVRRLVELPAVEWLDDMNERELLPKVLVREFGGPKDRKSVV